MKGNPKTKPLITKSAIELLEVDAAVLYFLEESGPATVDAIVAKLCTRTLDVVIASLGKLENAKEVSCLNRKTSLYARSKD